MRSILRGLAVLSLVFGLLLGGCRTKEHLTTTEKLARAESYLREHGGEAPYRALAYDLYLQVLGESDDPEQLRRAHFGVGIVGFLDLVQAIPTLATSLAGDGTGEGGVELPPADRLAELLDRMVEVVIEVGIVAHLEAVLADPSEFSFRFDKLLLPTTDPTAPPIDLGGEWDRTELGLISGSLSLVTALVDALYAYEGVVVSVLAALTQGEPLPPLPSAPAAVPAWLAEVMTVDGRVPWLDPEFGRLRDTERWARARQRLRRGLDRLAEAFAHLAAETDPQEDDLLPQDAPAGALLRRLLGERRQGVLALVGPAIDVNLPPTALAAFFATAATAIDDPTVAVLPPAGVWRLLDLLGTVHPGPVDPVGLAWPALRPGVLFASPVTDLKDPWVGVLPAYDPVTGGFVTATEQEPWSDRDGDGVVDADEFADVGVDGCLDADGDAVCDASGRPGEGDGRFNDPLGLRGDPDVTLGPLAHTDPHGRIQPPNGIVDPLYLFVPNPDLNGALAPVTAVGDPADPSYTVRTDRTYTNPDLMRLLSNLVWIADSLGSP